MAVFAGTPIQSAQPQAAPPERKVFQGSLVAPAVTPTPANDSGAGKLVFAGKPVTTTEDAPPNPYDLGSGGEGTAARGIAGFGKALLDTGKQIGEGILETAKIPGNVAAGKVAPEDIPGAARDVAALVGGGEASLLPRAGIARAAAEVPKPAAAEGIGLKPPEAAAEVPKPPASGSVPAAAQGSDDIARRMTEAAAKYPSREEFIRDYSAGEISSLDRHHLDFIEGEQRDPNTVYHGTSFSNVGRILDSGQIEPRVSSGDSLGERAISLTESRNAAKGFGVAFETGRPSDARDLSQATVGKDAVPGSELRSSNAIPLSQIKRAHIDVGAKEGLDTVLSSGERIGDVVDRLEKSGIPTIVSKVGHNPGSIWDSAHPASGGGIGGGTPTVFPGAPQGPLGRPPALTQPRTFEDQLFQLEGNKVADKIDTLKAVKNVPDGVPGETWEKLYHHEEDPAGVPLSPEEKALYDKHVAPLKAEGDQLASKLESFGYPVEEREHLPDQAQSDGYTPRYVSGRTRSFGEVLDQWKTKAEDMAFGGAPGRSMRKSVDAQKSRRFWNAVNPTTGERTVVHVGTDGKVLGFDGGADPREIGSFGKGQKIGEGAKVRVDGQTWKIEPATTKQIESVAKTRYSKNVLANRLDNVAKLRSAVRNAQFIEDMKTSPDWDKVAVKVGDQATPPVTNGRQWRIPKMPQFRQYYMEPHLADALDDALGRQRDIEGLESALDKAGNFIKGSIFWNPIPHMRNVANHYFVEKGLVGNVTGLASGSTFRSLLKAGRAVATQNEDYMRILRSGASLPYARSVGRDVHKALIAKLGEDVAAHPAAWQNIASLAGKANPVELIKSLYKVSNTALWSFGDMLNVARIMELEGKGRTLEKAIRETETHMPNYRIPGQVLGQRWISQLLQQPLATMFGRYQYNRLSSYMSMMREMVGRNVPLKERAAALDKLAMLGVVLTMYYPLLDKAWQKATGNENAKVSRPGAASVPQAMMDVASGDKGAAQGLSSVFSLGMVDAPIEATTGRYLWNGAPIAYPENLSDGHPDQFGRDLLAWLGSKLQPVGQAQRIAEGTTTPSQFLLQQIGVSTPTEKQANAKQYFQRKDAESATRRAMRLEGQRANQ